jgi:ABC-type antimicrobial peptide transport system permease subunit
VLGCAGLYGVMSMGVSQRTQEMGVRMAFGARAADVLSLVLKQGMRQVGWGVVIGMGLAVGLASVLGNFMFQVNPRDPVTFILIPALLVAVAAVACLVPAGRASSVDPIEALRHD